MTASLVLPLVVRKYGSKIGLIIAAITLGMGLIFFLILVSVNNHLEKSEINKVLKEHGGTVVHINKVDLEDSPFLNTMESRKGMRKQYSNTFYKIIYKKDGHKFIAWYRSGGGLFTVRGQTKDFNNKVIEETPENKKLIDTYGLDNNNV
ncbi:hypothetical protein [Paenibacillus hexagrammi]|uniref:Uncharacterized protein n=1 Tax=Paenibacillus hexagrammi TaxID=2908839 RepID=A0ABY3SRE5_9BACL|nr:hypothetical protein [Paenibacillus sp. YPD9-1]UJF35547.1 hypothetical protein L0M14_10860 [Paenibacillus sp. YPD9-1]